MTEPNEVPLIDRDALFDVIDGAIGGWTAASATVATNSVLAYLHEVLTPETLDSGSQSGWDVGVVDGAAAHRRIFGEDQ